MVRPQDDPYIRIASSREQKVSVLLRELALHQAADLLARIEKREVDRFPPILQSLDRATDRLASYRIANMLRAFRKFLAAPSYFDPLDRFGLFDPLDRDGALTSPASLVIQAILFSHAAWYRSRYHEAYSALEAYRDLAQLDEWDRGFVAALIAHQTLLRTSWSLSPKEGPEKEHAREVVAFEKGKLGPHFGGSANSSATDQAIARGLARTLFPFLPTEGQSKEDIMTGRRQLAAAQVLFSLCLQHRHLRTRDPRIDERREEILGFIAGIAESSGTPNSLVFCQYGRYVMRTQDECSWTHFRNQYLLKWADKAASSEKNVSVSFNRYTARGRQEGVVRCGWKGNLEAFQLDPQLRSGRAQDDPGIAQAIEATVGLCVVIDDQQIPASAFGRDAEPKQPRGCLPRLLRRGGPITDATRPTLPEEIQTHADFSAMFKELLNRRIKQYPEAYRPAPLIGRILDLARQLNPDLFSKVRLTPVGLSAEIAGEGLIARPLTLYLPRADPKELDPEHAWLIARYVVAMVMFLEVMLGPRQVELDFLSNEVRKKWEPWIRESLRLLGHDGILRYLRQIHTAPCAVTTADQLLPRRLGTELPGNYKLKPKSYVLGLDIGGTGVKCGLLKVFEIPSKEAATKRLGVKLAGGDYQCEIPTGRLAQGLVYRSLEDLMVEIVRALHEKEWPLSDVIGVGIGWPGAVRDGSTVAGASGILGNFVDFVDFPRIDVDARRLHELDLCANFWRAFQRVLNPRNEPGKEPSRPVIVALNDGDADIKATADQVTPDRVTPDRVTPDRVTPDQVTPEPSQQHVSLVLKAGTGTACGVYIGGKQVPMLAEAGKLLVDLGAARIPGHGPEDGEMPDQESYPPGLMNLFCSKKTLPDIAAQLGWKPGKPEDPPIDAREIGYFIARALKAEAKAELEQIVKKLQAAGGEERIRLVETWAKSALDDEGLKQKVREHFNMPKGKKVTVHQLALFCAALAGRQLGDCLALLVQGLRARRIRLGGGALSRSTGEQVCKSAIDTLREVYGLEVDEGDEEKALDLHALAEVRKISVQRPAVDDTGIPTGIRGAAFVARDALVLAWKGKELRDVRSKIEGYKAGDRFEVKELCDTGTETPSALLPADIEAMLQPALASLGIYYQVDEGYYEKLDLRLTPPQTG